MSHSVPRVFISYSHDNDEHSLIFNEFQNSNTVSSKFIPVVFDADDQQHVPAPFGDRNSYVLDQQAGYENLYWVLTGQTREAPPLGARKRRPHFEPEVSVLPRTSRCLTRRCMTRRLPRTSRGRNSNDGCWSLRSGAGPRRRSHCG